MGLQDIDFSSLPYTWRDAQRLSFAVFPEHGMNADQRYNLHMARMLLSVLLLAALRHRLPNMAYVQRLASEMDRAPEEISRDLSDPMIDETHQAVKASAKCIGSLFCEPTKFLMMNITQERAVGLNSQLRGFVFSDR
jgi:hypothetical protein